MRNVNGSTLAELIVVLAILGLIAGVSGLALASLRVPRESQWLRDLRRARAEAIATGRAVVVSIPDTTPGRHSDLPSLRASVAFLPDGRALGPGLDPLTGAPNALR